MVTLSYKEKKKKKTGRDFRCFFLLLEIKTSAWTGAFKFIFLKLKQPLKKRQQLLALTLAKVLASAMPGLFFFFLKYGNSGASQCEKLSQRICVNHTKTPQTQPAWRGPGAKRRYICRQAGDISNRDGFCIPAGNRSWI